jgi:hypothetical protein
MIHVRRAVPVLVTSLLVFAASAQGEESVSFFRNQRIALVLGYNPGGSYDLNANIAANWLPRFIPGKPTVVIRV